MTAVVARKTSRRRVSPPVESTVYNGRELCGTITPKADSFIARLVSGRSLGRFANERLAQRAITSAARLERPQQFRSNPT
jgi:hypothetical protein